MKSKTYTHGKINYKAYLKTVGRGFEVGFLSGTKPIFVGNFIHAKDANAWYALMNKEIVQFSKKYWVTTKTSKNFYLNFITNHLYTLYYKQLDKIFTRYNRQYKTQFTKSEKRYNQLQRNWDTTEKETLRRGH